MVFSMPQPRVVTGDAPDRRRRPRFRLAYPVRLRQPGEAVGVETQTQDLSCEGFFCLSERSFSSYQTLECELIIAGRILGHPLEDVMVIHCRAEVVRVVPRSRGVAFGVACRFADYRIDW
jgi:hypothetical protein